MRGEKEKQRERGQHMESKMADKNEQKHQRRIKGKQLDPTRGSQAGRQMIRRQSRSS